MLYIIYPLHQPCSSALLCSLSTPLSLSWFQPHFPFHHPQTPTNSNRSLSFYQYIWCILKTIKNEESKMNLPFFCCWKFLDPSQISVEPPRSHSPASTHEAMLTRSCWELVKEEEEGESQMLLYFWPPTRGIHSMNSMWQILRKSFICIDGSLNRNKLPCA